MRTACLLALSMIALAPSPPPQQQEENVFIDEIRPEFLEEISVAAEAKDWRQLLELYRFGFQKYRYKNVKVKRTFYGRQVDQWISVGDYLIDRYSKLPSDALEIHGLEYDGLMLNALRNAAETGDFLELERQIDPMFFSKHTDEALDFLANRYFQAGRVNEALYYWNRLLHFCPDTDLPRATIAARMAVACQEANSESVFHDLRRWINGGGVPRDAEVIVGGRKMSLGDLLGKIRFTAPESAGTVIAKLPDIPAPLDQLRPAGEGVRNDILRWTYDFVKNDGASKERVPDRRRGMPPQPAASASEFPIIPTYALAMGREYVLFTNGYRLIAVNPRRARGDSPSSGVYWTYPENGAIKRPKKNVQRYYRAIFTSPYVGCTVDGDVAYVTMYSSKKENDPGPNQMDAYDGPTTVKAVSLEKGKVIWDTDEKRVQTEKDGLVPVLQQYDFYDRNWSFSAPPIVRGDRLYVGINTSPMGEQESRVLCLDKRSGTPLWCTFISSVSGGFGRFGFGVSNRYVACLTMLEESGGVLYVQSNLGVVAALNSVTGNVLWMNTYKRMGRTGGRMAETFVRPGDRPLLHRGRLYCLPQDARELLVYDAVTGRPLDGYVDLLRNAGRKDFNWKDVYQLIPVDDQWLVLGGTESRIVNFSGDPFPQLNSQIYRRDLKRQEEIRQETVKKLETEKVSVDYRNVSLEEAARDLCNRTGLRLEVGDGLTDFYSAEELKITLKADEAPLQEVLQSILGVANLAAAFIREEAVLRFVPREKVYPFAGANTSRCGRGLMHRGLLYLPTFEPNNRHSALALYEHGSWRMLDQKVWKESAPYGNLLIAGEYLVVATGQKVEIYTDLGTLTGEFVQRLKQSPKHAPSFLEHGNIMRENGHLAEAADSYLEFISAAEGDPRYEPKIREVRFELYHIFLKRGIESASGKTRGRPEGEQLREAVEHFRRAKGFAYDEKTRTSAALKLAEVYERLKMAREAIREYQGVIEKSRDEFHTGKDGDTIEKAWVFAKKRISELIETYDREVYEPVEREARKALKKIGETDLTALREFVERYPNSEASAQAFRTWVQGLWKAGRLEKIPSALEEFRKRYADEFDREMWQKLLDALEKLGDFSRLRLFLPRYAEEYGKEIVRVGDEDLTVEQWVRRRLEELDAAAEKRPEPGPFHLAARLPSGEDDTSQYRVSTVLTPLRPLGIRPATLGENLELFAKGSAIELWDVGPEPRKLWTCPHPGGYLGVAYSDVKGGTVNGVRVLRILTGSPAAKAGLETGDILTLIDGRKIVPEEFDRELARLTPGSKVKLVLSRNDKTHTVEVELGTIPEDIAPLVIGASFTRDYSLAVAWQDAAASLDLTSGSVTWTFRSVRSRFHLRGFHAVNGRLLVHETMSKNSQRTRDPLRTLTREYEKVSGELPADEQHSRLICLDDANGRVLWGRKFSFDVGGRNPDSMTFESKYLSGSVAFLWKAIRTNVERSELCVLRVEDGSDARREPVRANLFAHAFDLDRGVFYWVDGGRTLRSVPLSVDAGEGAAPLDINLQRAHFTPAHQKCVLAARGDYVVVAVLPVGEANPARVVVYSTKTRQEFRRIQLLPGRTLPSVTDSMMAVDEDGILYLYNLPDSKKPDPRQGGFVTAYRLAAEGSEDPLWDAPAPGMRMNGDRPMLIAPTPGHVVLFLSEGCTPGEGERGPRAVAYEKKRGGYLVRAWENILDRTGPENRSEGTVRLFRGRLYVSTRAGLEVYEEKPQGR